MQTAIADAKGRLHTKQANGAWARERTDAEHMDGQTIGLRAWNWDTFPAIKANIVRRTSNQFGTVYTFKDGSRGIVRKGVARFRATY